MKKLLAAMLLILISLLSFSSITNAAEDEVVDNGTTVTDVTSNVENVSTANLFAKYSLNEEGNTEILFSFTGTTSKVLSGTFAIELPENAEFISIEKTENLGENDDVIEDFTGNLLTIDFLAEEAINSNGDLFKIVLNLGENDVTSLILSEEVNELFTDSVNGETFTVGEIEFEETSLDALISTTSTNEMANEENLDLEDTSLNVVTSTGALETSTGSTVDTKVKTGTKENISFSILISIMLLLVSYNYISNRKKS